MNHSTQQHIPLPNVHHCPWDSMALSTRLSCVMSIFPRRLWGYIITEPMFSPEEMYEVDAYFGYSRRYRNLQPRTYWDHYTPPAGCYDNYRYYTPQMSFVHHVVNHHNVNIVAHEYSKHEESPLTPVSPKSQNGADSPRSRRGSSSEASKGPSINPAESKEKPIKRKASECEEDEGNSEKRVKIEPDCEAEPISPESPDSSQKLDDN